MFIRDLGNFLLDDWFLSLFCTVDLGRFKNFSLSLCEARARLLVADLAELLANDLQVVVSVLLDVEGPLMREQLHLPGDVAD